MFDNEVTKFRVSQTSWRLGQPAVLTFLLFVIKGINIGHTIIDQIYAFFILTIQGGFISSANSFSRVTHPIQVGGKSGFC